MNDRELLTETAADLFQRTTPLLGRDRKTEVELGRLAWSAIERAELHVIGVSGEHGGAGDVGDACAVLRVSGRYACPVPLMETLLARWVLGEAGLEAPEGPLTIDNAGFAELPEIGNDGTFVSGQLERVPYPDQAKSVIVLAAQRGAVHVCLIDVATARKQLGQRITGQELASVDLVGSKPSLIARSPVSADALTARGALYRAQEIAGALSRVLEFAIEFSTQRVQFGRPIARFQAIQHHLADIAAEATAAEVAAENAADLASTGDAQLAAAIAKTRTGLACRAASVAHQVHGAMGATEEYPLHLFTRRLWDWRDDFGSETQWSEWLGNRFLRTGSSAIWQEVARIG
jgi:acyl-CoA dehydrogenase